MIEVFVNGEWIQQTPNTGDVVREWFGEGDLRHYIKYDSYVKVSDEDNAKQWRNSELQKTDWIVPVTDHPQHAAYLTYRQALRDWPQTADFPNVRPVLAV